MSGRQFGNYAAATQRRHNAAVARRARFAELIAEGYTITAAARSLGVTQQCGSKMMADISCQFGERAS